MVFRLWQYFQKEKVNKGPLSNVDKVVERVSEATGIHRNTISSILKEGRNGEDAIMTPGKKREKKFTKTGIDSFTEAAIRNHIYAYYERKEIATIPKLMSSLQEAELFDGSDFSLRKILSNLGFKWKKINNRLVLKERTDIVALRCEFLRAISDVDFNQVIFLDETWVNAGHTVTTSWSDGSVKSARKEPVGKGGRLIITHAGSAQGFIPNCFSMFRSKKTGDYHQDMNADVFHKWFISLLDNIAPNSIIVMDNASYHSVLADRAPTAASKKVDVQEWLKSKGIPYPPSSLKGELLGIVKEHKPRFKTYVLDEIARERGHRVIRLPPYHCEFNPIELIWAQIKNRVASENREFTLNAVERLTKEAVDAVTVSDWFNAVRHTRKLIEGAWEKEIALEQYTERLIIHLEDGDFNSDDDADDPFFSDDDGITELPEHDPE